MYYISTLLHFCSQMLCLDSIFWVELQQDRFSTGSIRWIPALLIMFLFGLFLNSSIPTGQLPTCQSPYCPLFHHDIIHLWRTCLPCLKENKVTYSLPLEEHDWESDKSYLRLPCNNLTLLMLLHFTTIRFNIDNLHYGTKFIKGHIPVSLSPVRPISTCGQFYRV